MLHSQNRSFANPVDPFHTCHIGLSISSCLVSLCSMIELCMKTVVHWLSFAYTGIQRQQHWTTRTRSPCFIGVRVCFYSFLILWWWHRHGFCLVGFCCCMHPFGSAWETSCLLLHCPELHQPKQGAQGLLSIFLCGLNICIGSCSRYGFISVE